MRDLEIGQGTVGRTGGETADSFMTCSMNISAVDSSKLSGNTKLSFLANTFDV